MLNNLYVSAAEAKIHARGMSQGEGPTVLHCATFANPDFVHM